MRINYPIKNYFYKKRGTCIKTKFTDQELYEAYKKEVIYSLVFDFGLGIEQANKIIKEKKLKEKFLSDTRSYDFITPSKVARIFYNMS